MSEKFKGEYLGYGMIFWFGVVEDRQDPIKLGRVRVRIYGWHDEKRLNTYFLFTVGSGNPATKLSC